MRQHGRGETRNDPARQRDPQLRAARQVLLLLGRHAVVDELGAPLIDGELPNGVGYLLGEDGDEAGVQAGKTLGAGDFGEAGKEARGVLWLLGVWPGGVTGPGVQAR